MTGKLLLTGDIHGEHDIRKLSTKKLNANELNLTKEDYLIITGDFGLIWEGTASSRERYWLNWLDEKPWTTLFVDGNHENHARLDDYPVTLWNGGKIHEVSDSVIHLMRGQVFDLQGKKFFTMGGAYSHDIEFRIPDRSWWAREVPSFCEREEALANLAAHDNKVDYIITHDAPEIVAQRLIRYSGDWSRRLDEYEKWLQENIADKVEFKMWFHGHHHIDYEFYDGKYQSMYYDIVSLGDNGVSFVNDCWR